MSISYEAIHAPQFRRTTTALVREVGDLYEAEVFALIEFRTRPKSPAGYLVDGVRWWRASIRWLAEHLGMTVEQVRRCIRNLLAKGHIRKAKHHGVTIAYTAVVAPQKVPDPPVPETEGSPTEEPAEAGALLVNPPNLKRHPLPPAGGSGGRSRQRPPKTDAPLPADWGPHQRHYALAAALGINLHTRLHEFRDWVEDAHVRARNWGAMFSAFLRRTNLGSGPDTRTIPDPLNEFPCSVGHDWVLAPGADYHRWCSRCRIFEAEATIAPLPRPADLYGTENEF